MVEKARLKRGDQVVVSKDTSEEEGQVYEVGKVGRKRTIARVGGVKVTQQKIELQIVDSEKKDEDKTS
jgi:hypothetical protein